MVLEEYICPVCGSNELEEVNGEFKCKSCGRVFHNAEDKSLNVEKAIIDCLNQFQLDLYSKAKLNLWREVHRENLSNNDIKKWCDEVQKYSPDDFLSNFYETVTFSDVKTTQRCLSKYTATGDYTFVDEVLSYLIKIVDDSSLINNLTEIINEAPLSDELSGKYQKEIADLAEKLDEGIFNTDLIRDVFICYSSKDLGAVTKLVNYLEDNEYNCFYSQRNLRHGKGAKENYELELQKAMHNSKCIVFVSTENSRTMNCDAIKVEIPYLRDNEPNKGRIEYVIDKSKYPTTKAAAKNIIESYFAGQEYCTDKEDLLGRIAKYTTGFSNQEKKGSSPIPKLNFGGTSKASSLSGGMRFANSLGSLGNSSRTEKKREATQQTAKKDDSVENYTKKLGTIDEFAEKLTSTRSINKKIQMIKLYPIPNDREGVLAFMNLAASNFDEKYYATHPKTSSISSAWRSKISECYRRAQTLLNGDDMHIAQEIYDSTIAKAEKIKKTKMIMKLVGIGLIILGFVIVGLTGTSSASSGTDQPTTTSTGSSIGAVVFLIGVILTIIGFVKKKSDVEAENNN